MTRNVQEYWREVRAIEQGLPEFVWLVSKGQVAQAARAVAAQLIRKGSHQQATEEEVATHLAAEKEAVKRARREEKARQGAVVVALEENY